MKIKKRYESPKALIIIINTEETVRSISGITEGDGGDVLMDWFFGG